MMDSPMEIEHVHHKTKANPINEIPYDACIEKVLCDESRQT